MDESILRIRERSEKPQKKKKSLKKTQVSKGIAWAPKSRGKHVAQ